MGSTGRGNSVQEHTFEGTPDSLRPTHEISGGMHDTIEWFWNNTNSYELIDQILQNGDEEAFQDWSNGYLSMGGIQYLPWKDIPDFDKAAMLTLDRYLDQATNSEAFVVNRLATWELLNNGSQERPDLDNMEGLTVYCSGNLSTCAAKTGLSIGSRLGDTPGYRVKTVEYRIHIPAGSKGAGMWIGDPRINGWGAKQREFLMNRDSFYRVGGHHKDSRRNIEIVDLYWMGRFQHTTK